MTVSKIERQVSRYCPSKLDTYYDLNLEITKQLDSLRGILAEKRILDYGAGECPFKQYFKGLNVETADVYQNSEGSIKTILDPNSKTLPFADQSFDYVFMFDVLEHVKYDRELASELNRIIAPGGGVIGNVPFLYRFHEEPVDFRRYTPSGLRHLFVELGLFKEELIHPIGSHYFVARKCLEEISFPLKKPKSWYVQILRFLLKLGSPGDISFNSPFSYFFIFRK